MEKKLLGFAGAALCVGLIGIGTALASWVHFSAAMDEVQRDQKAQSKNVVSLKDDIATLELRIKDVERQTRMDLAHRDFPPDEAMDRPPEEIRRLREEIEEIREASLETEEGEQAVLDILARHRTNFAEKAFEKKQEWTHQNLQRFYEHFQVDQEKAAQSTELYDTLMQTWHDLGVSFVEREKPPKQLQEEFFEANKKFREDVFRLYGDELGGKFVRTVLPNRRFRQKLFGVR